MSVDIPISLSLAESGAVALDAAAKNLSDAADADGFIAALDNNLRLWLTLTAVAYRFEWGMSNGRTVGYVVETSRRAGRAVNDWDVDALIDIDRDLSARLAQGRRIENLRRRALLAWRENGRRHASLESWLIAEIERKARLH